MRNKLAIPFLGIPGIPSPEDVATYMNRFEPILIQSNPWPNFKHFVKANYTIAHNGNAIFLKYVVQENYLQAVATTNGEIHQDSCVEFFIALDENENYYNLEFNCLGSSKIGYGASRSDRVLLASNLVELIASVSKIKTHIINSKKVFAWEIILVIPLTVFCYSPINSFKGVKAQGNFYKCGDELPQPHYLTWNFIKANGPDFHRPECFGDLEFI
ncbi:MAG TPA: carbohydrate-binding family 9-like protein [Pelobium sp.]|nr:carbohydrate-binding family 9-like protein [Pelobium sp.]